MTSPFAFANYYEKEEIAIYENLFLKSDEFKKSCIKINEYKFNYTITNVISKDPTKLIIARKKKFHNTNKFNLLNYKVIENYNNEDFSSHPYIVNLIIFIHKMWLQSKIFAINTLQIIDKYFGHLDGSVDSYKIVRYNLKDVLLKESPEILFDNKINLLIDIYLNNISDF